MLPNSEQLIAEAIEAVATEMIETALPGASEVLQRAIAEGVIRTLDKLGWGLTPPVDLERDLLAGYDPSRATGDDYNLHWRDVEDRADDPWPSPAADASSTLDMERWYRANGGLRPGDLSPLRAKYSPARTLSDEMELAAARLDELLGDLGRVTGTEWFVEHVGGGNMRIRTRFLRYRDGQLDGYRQLAAAADGDCYLPDDDEALWWLVEEHYDRDGEQVGPENDPNETDLAQGRVLGVELRTDQLVRLVKAHNCEHYAEHEDGDVCVVCEAIFCPDCHGTVTVDMEEGEYLHERGAVCHLVGKKSVVG